MVIEIFITAWEMNFHSVNTKSIVIRDQNSSLFFEFNPSRDLVCKSYHVGVARLAAIVRRDLSRGM